VVKDISELLAYGKPAGANSILNIGTAQKGGGGLKAPLILFCFVVGPFRG
jgi:hypothetical protein